MSFPISVCLIAKNEEKKLHRCLRSVYPFVSQIVFVDTGSIDNSKNIAAEYESKIVDFAWCDDFSAARNKSLEEADRDWLLVLDADETVPPYAWEIIGDLIKKNNNAYNIVTKNYTKETTCTNWFPLGPDDQTAQSLGYSGWYPSYKVRLLRNGLGLKFEGRVHELIKTDAETAKFFIEHFTEEEKQTEAWLKKKEYYLFLGQLKLSDNPNDAQANFELGLQFSELKKPEQAEICFKRTLEINPNFGDNFYGNANFELGNIYSIFYKKPLEAIEYFKRGIELRPEHSPSYYNLAFVHQTLDQFDLAEQYYKKATEVNPKFAVAYNNLANILIDKKKYQDALKYANQAISLNPTIKTAHQNAAYCLFELGETEKAIENSKKLLNDDPSDSGTAYNLGRFYYKLEDLDNAIKYFKLSARGNPTKSEAYNHIAKIYVDLGLFVSAEKQFEECLSKCGRDPITLNNFAKFKSSIGQKDIAAQLIEEANARVPKKPVPAITKDDRTKVVASIILRNESERIKEAIEIGRLAANELIILDTRSKPSNIEYAKNTKVYFEAHLNENQAREKMSELLKEAKPDWILELDADLLFEHEIIDEIKTLVQNDDVDGYHFSVKKFWKNKNYYLTSENRTYTKLYRPKQITKTYSATTKLRDYSNLDTITEKTQTIKQALSAKLDYNKKATIILQANDNLEKCLTALNENTDYPNETVVILSSNHSEYENLIADFLYKGMRIFPVKSDCKSNIEAYNEGISWNKANGPSEYLVFLGCDILVSPNWLSKLIKHVQTAPYAGAVCPRINNVYGPQNVNWPNALTVSDFRIKQVSEKFNSDNRGILSRINDFSDLCFAMKRKTIDETGPFCEDLEDYCSKITKNHEIYLANDTFVFNMNTAHIEPESGTWDDAPSIRKIVSNIIIGIAAQELPDQTVSAIRVEFDDMDHFKNFIETKYDEMYEAVRASDPTTSMEMGIALLPPDVNQAQSKDIHRFKFATKESGLSLLRDFISAVRQSNA